MQLCVDFLHFFKKHVEENHLRHETSLIVVVKVFYFKTVVKER